MINENFKIVKRKMEDNVVASNYTDRLSNNTDVSEFLVQEKILLLSVASRAKLTVVSGEIRPLNYEFGCIWLSNWNFHIYR